MAFLHGPGTGKLLCVRVCVCVCVCVCACVRVLNEGILLSEAFLYHALQSDTCTTISQYMIWPCPFFFVQAHSVAWNCDGRRLASGSMDYTVAMFLCDKDSCTVVSWSL